MKKQRLIIVGVVVVVIITIGAGVFFKLHGGVQSEGSKAGSQGTSNNDPTDIVLDFYNPWLEALRSTSTDPYQSGLATAPILSKTLSDKLVASLGHAATLPDPVLCQTKLPSAIATRIVYTLENKEQVLVTAKDKDLTGQSIITLNKNNDGWYIDDIQCAPGEFEAPREFTFENVGFLLQKSVPSPYNSNNWHIVFAQDGKQGYVAPLLFDGKSMCTAPDGSTAVCDPSKFEETAKVSVHGQMTEYGVQVQKMELTNEEFPSA